MTLWGALAVIAVIAIALSVGGALYRLSVERELRRFLVPHTDDPRWTGQRVDEITFEFTLGPFRLCRRGGYSWLYVADHDTDLSETATRWLFSGICRARGLTVALPSREETAKRQAVEAAVKWRAEGEPKPLGPETDEHKQGAFR